jgi:hypothetical protein
LCRRSLRIQPMKIVAFVWCISGLASSFRFQSPLGPITRFQGTRLQGIDPRLTAEFRATIATSDLQAAIVCLLNDHDRRVDVSRDDAIKLLNAVPGLSQEAIRMMKSQQKSGTLVPSTAEQSLVQIQEKVSALYSLLGARGVLRGFGACGAGDEPLLMRGVRAEDLPSVIGLNQTALTPGSQIGNWLSAGVGICFAESVGAQLLGFDPLVTVLPASVVLFLADRLLLRGAVFESVLRALFPLYTEKIVRHEAAHFLVAYLNGCPIESCVTNSWEALKDPRYQYTAGTLFFDPDFSRQAMAGKVTSTTVDRYSMIVMAGIAAEAAAYGQAEGGASDEQAIVQLLVTMTRPSWTLPRVQDQARWGVVQASLLLKEHARAYEALVTALARNAPLGECVAAIEGALDPELPSARRREQRAADRAAAEKLAKLSAEVALEAAILAPKRDRKAELEEKIREVEDKIAGLDAKCSGV